MAEGSVMLRMVLAALASGGASGLLLAAQMSVLLLSPRVWGGGLFDPTAFAVLLAGGAVVGLLLATVPAFAAGAALWALQRRYAAAAGRTAWAWTGAGGGALVWALFELASAWLAGRFDPLGFSALLLAACLGAGAGAALVFRATMHATGGLTMDSA